MHLSDVLLGSSVPFPPWPPRRAGRPVSGWRPRCVLCSCGQLRVQTVRAIQFWGRPTGSTSGFGCSSRELWEILQRHKPCGSSQPSEPSSLQGRALTPAPPPPSARTTAGGTLHCAPTGARHPLASGQCGPTTFSDGGGDPSLTPFLEEKTEAQRGWKLDKRAGAASVLPSTRSGT